MRPELQHGVEAPERAATSSEGTAALPADFCHLQKLESLGLMVGEVAHDLNNTLAIILGHTELAIDETERKGFPPARLEDIREAVVHAAALCRGMLAYAGRASPIRTAVDLAELVAHLQQLLRVTVPRQSRLDCQVAHSLPRLIGDPSHMRQILMNLILNAVEALGGKPGTIRVVIDRTVSADPADKGTPWIGIRVSDTGCGMSTEVLKNLFNPFYSTKAEGRGLGLTAVRNLVEGMGGTIEAHSVPGQGTTFTLLFPALQADEGVPDLDSEDAVEDDPGWTGSGTVLLVDDEPELRMLGSAMLGQAGLRVLTATDGQEAVECYQQHDGEIDLVFLDAVMPRMDGCEALARIRQIDPRAKVVMISGHTEFDLVHRWNGARPDDILLKPVSARKLRRAAKRHLAKLRDPARDEARMAGAGTDRP